MKPIDTLFPLLLKEWKDSWVAATNSPGELKCQVEAAWGDGFDSAEDLIGAMDAAGVGAVLATDLLAWSYTRHERFARDMTGRIEEIAEQYPGRVYGLADYDPQDIGGSLDKLERDLDTGAFKGLYIHTYGFDIGLDDRKMYPLYAYCQSRGVPVTMQIGHVLEAMPSEHGRPMQLDRIACDFPKLVMVGTHTGWPWVSEALAVCMKWPNVYLSASAWLPKYMDPAFLRYMGSRTGSTKVMFGTNGLDWGRYLKSFEGLGIHPDRTENILHNNAKRVFGL